MQSTSIRRRYHLNTSKTKLGRIYTSFLLFRCNFLDQKTHVVSTYFFQRNFTGQKNHVVSTYFFRCNYHGQKIHVDSTYFFICNFSGSNIHIAFITFFDVILMSKNSTSFLESCKLTETFEEVFLCL